MGNVAIQTQTVPVSFSNPGLLKALNRFLQRFFTKRLDGYEILAIGLEVSKASPTSRSALRATLRKRVSALKAFI